MNAALPSKRQHCARRIGHHAVALLSVTVALAGPRPPAVLHLRTLAPSHGTAREKTTAQGPESRLRSANGRPGAPAIPHVRFRASRCRFGTLPSTRRSRRISPSAPRAQRPAQRPAQCHGPRARSLHTTAHVHRRSRTRAAMHDKIDMRCLALRGDLRPVSATIRPGALKTPHNTRDIPQKHTDVRNLALRRKSRGVANGSSTRPSPPIPLRWPKCAGTGRSLPSPRGARALLLPSLCATAASPPTCAGSTGSTLACV